MCCKTESIFAALPVWNRAEAHRLTPWNIVDTLYLGPFQSLQNIKKSLYYSYCVFLLILCACAAYLPSEAPRECVICLTSPGQHSLILKYPWSYFCSAFRRWLGCFHQIPSFELYSKQKHWLIKLDLYFKCSALCSIVFVHKLQMLGFVPPSSVRVHKRRQSELFLPFMFLLLPRHSLCCVRQLRMEPFCLLQFLKWNISLLNAYLSCPADCASRTNTHMPARTRTHTHTH